MSQENADTPTIGAQLKDGAYSQNGSSDGGTNSLDSKNGDGSGTSEDSTNSLMFPKRDVSLTTQRSVSSFTNHAQALRQQRRSLKHYHNKKDASVLGTSCDCPCPSPPQSPPLHTDEHVRIRTPASAMASRRNSFDIGTRMPFTDKPSPASERLDPADSFLKMKPTKSEKRHYEIAKVIMSTPSSPQKSQLGEQLQHTANSSAGSHTGSTARTTPSTSPRSQSAMLPLRARASRTNLIPPLANSDLSSVEVAKGSQSPLKQIHEPKQPLYIPAVLRPTSKTSYQTQRTQSAASTARQNSIRPPTRDHWVSNESSDECSACKRKFGFFERRHHCRKCGGLFCKNDSRYVIGLDRQLNYNLFGFPSRSCRRCWEDFTHTILQASRLNTDPTPVTATQTSQGGMQGITIGKRLEPNTEPAPVVGSLVPNVPDWSWSTF